MIPHPDAEFTPEVQDFAARWGRLPENVQRALLTLREFEEEGAYNPTLLHTPVRGFFRQCGGTSAFEPEPDFIYALRPCPIPPRGWRCARPRNHTGPCAARPSLWNIKWRFKMRNFRDSFS